MHHIELWAVGVFWVINMLYADLIGSIFEWVLAMTVLILGVCYGLHRYYKQSSSRGYAENGTIQTNNVNIMLSSALPIVRTLATYFLPLLFLFLFRSFLFDGNRVITGSLKPTILIGETILVNKFRYGLRLPLIGTPLTPLKSPDRGDIVVFRLPQDRSKIFVKRLIGLPGDHIQYKQKCLIINGESASQRVLGVIQEEQSSKESWAMLHSQENLQGRRHAIYTRLDEKEKQVKGMQKYPKFTEDFSLIVPPGQYFVMGDNRDSSWDSRYWGCLPGNFLLGEARYVIFSWDKTSRWDKPLTWIRWKRLGTKII
jgi:signal peptidase I